MEPFTLLNDSIMQLSSSITKDATLIAGMTTRFGGRSVAPFSSLNMGFHVPDDPSMVLDNRQIVADMISLPLSNWVMGEQVHETNIHVVTKNDQNLGKGTLSHQDALKGIDGLITNQANVLLTAMFADCVPLYYWDPTTNWIGIAHAGWRGTVNQMAAHMVSKLTDLGADVTSLRVAIGPSISAQNYQVDEKVYQLIPKKWRDQVTEQIDSTHYFFDLKKLHKIILVDIGVNPEHIFVTNYCTYQDDYFFSHRKENGKTGRMLGFIGSK
ncbi:laccase domain protein YlmD [Paraliobacillus quinghaiensis]|uniref:Purine nucleoside phosphorylase n=1 Tax=Paraliobacillus quinghaiensis TaxID=470815 RepID=A0A917THB0_9BACI|nr:peptidoglycan editing factor PgeF [Paraliobacillus quinghaiensis]GGM20727.1 laccase domain protein YlmD [Paraliobacillus quinghaiensis]